MGEAKADRSHSLAGEWVPILIYMHRSTIHRTTWLAVLDDNELPGERVVAGPFATLKRHIEDSIRDSNEYVAEIAWTRFGANTWSPKVRFRDDIA